MCVIQYLRAQLFSIEHRLPRLVGDLEWVMTAIQLTMTSCCIDEYRFLKVTCP